MSATYRILHCLRAPVGGLFRHVCDLAGAQAERGHAVGLLADSSIGDRLTDVRLDAIAPKLTLGITRTPMSRLPGLGDLAAARVAYELARRVKADVLHGHGAKGGAYARLAGRLLRARGASVSSFYTPHGGSLHYEWRTPQGAIMLGMERMQGRITDGLIFESDYAARAYRERVGPSSAPARVIHNGLQPQDFLPHQSDADAADFLFVGELRHLKGVDVLLEALALVERSRPVRLCVVGSGPDRDSLLHLAHSLGLEDRVQFPGTMPGPEAFALGRCLIVPSRAESFPYIVLEAAAAGMPLIATNVGGIPEIVEGIGARLIPPGDVQTLALAMLTFLTEEDAARAAAAQLKSAVAERFTVSRMADAVLAFYTAAVERPR